jgi:phosphate/sulfate permease
MPSSSSHALIGGLVGADLSAGGTDAINWESVRKSPAGGTTPARSRCCS